jgi:hypothetical protein
MAGLQWMGLLSASGHSMSIGSRFGATSIFAGAVNAISTLNETEASECLLIAFCINRQCPKNEHRGNAGQQYSAGIPEQSVQRIPGADSRRRDSGAGAGCHAPAK